MTARLAVWLWRSVCCRYSRKCLFSISLWSFFPCFTAPTLEPTENARLLEFYFWIAVLYVEGVFFCCTFHVCIPHGFNNGLIFEIVFKSAYLRWAAHSWAPSVCIHFVLVSSTEFFGLMYFSRINIQNLGIAYLIFRGEIYRFKLCFTISVNIFHN